MHAATRPPATRRRGPAKSPPQSARIIDYQSLFEQAPDAILVVDSEGHYIDANPAACVLTGYTRDELLQMRIGDLTTPSERPRSAERFDLLQKTGRTRADRILQRKDGTQVPVEAHAIELGDGTYQTIIRDITERLNAQQELQRSLDAYSTLVGLCNAAVIAADSRGRITSWNPAAEALFGYSATEAGGMPMTKLIPRRLRRTHLSSFRRHADSATEEPFGRTIYTEALRKDGTEVPVEIAVAVGQQAGRPVYTAVVRDFAEHRNVIEKLNDALQRLQFHVERMPLAYIVWDTDFRVVEWNPAAERTFGYAKSEAVGKHAYDLIVPPDAVSAVDAVWFDLLKGDTSSHSINANVRKDGSRLTCEWFNTPLRDSVGRIRGVASMTVDVSKREAMEAQIRDAQKLEGLGVMASGIAHDFNSSLMIILGNTALLRSVKGLPAGAIEHIELIEEAGSRADALIKRLLAYSRTGRHNPQPTDLNTVIQDAIKFVRSSVGKRHDLKLRLADDLATILADRSQVEQILLNLCFNAKEAMADGGAIAITTRCAELTAADAVRCVPPDSRPGRYVVMVVTDTGCGMDEGTVMRMFDPFFTTKVEGHGLGLAAVLGILRQHSAMAMIDSKPAAGTEVRVFFPVHQEETKPKRRRPARKRRS
ncbi:MAG: PAS domain S-box protein [Phycisphaerales bacterium]|nr:MAG: PAS domain S-box protein [Phycisphaerales bacterium]